MEPNADIAALNASFGLGQELEFQRHPSGLVYARIRSALAEATIFLQGAHLTAWKPMAEPFPVIWLSSDARFVQGKGPRGGIPICWPWFGPAQEGSGLPAHGFVRTVPWQPVHSERLEDGRIRIDLAIASDTQTTALWPHSFRLVASFLIGTELSIELVTENTGTTPFSVGEALHTYFRVDDISGIEVDGLESIAYLDKTAAGDHGRQHGRIRFDGECDRVYLNAPSSSQILDPALKRRIHIEQAGAASVVVWSPGQEKADRLGDLGAVHDLRGGWRDMVCVESGNAFDNTVTVAPGGHHRLAVCYRVLRDI